MKYVRYSTAAKKDLKRYRNDLRKMQSLYETLAMIVRDIPLPGRYRPHMLKGRYAGCMECHVGSDFLLIWLDEEENTVEVVRVGTHSELF